MFVLCEKTEWKLMGWNPSGMAPQLLCMAILGASEHSC